MGLAAAVMATVFLVILWQQVGFAVGGWSWGGRGEVSCRGPKRKVEPWTSLEAVSRQASKEVDSKTGGGVLD